MVAGKHTTSQPETNSSTTNEGLITDRCFPNGWGASCRGISTRGKYGQKRSKLVTKML